MDVFQTDVETLANACLANNLRIVTAESCTGGGLAAALTALPGCSAWFNRGVVTYSNRSKEALLSVPPDTLAQYGAVSEQTALAMAEGALAHSKGDLSIAITGIAGPAGGTPDKPVGTVWFGFQVKGEAATAQHQCFEGDRASVRTQAVSFALQHAAKLLTDSNAV